jgi:hypothetical protein
MPLLFRRHFHYDAITAIDTLPPLLRYAAIISFIFAIFIDAAIDA